MNRIIKVVLKIVFLILLVCISLKAGLYYYDYGDNQRFIDYAGQNIQTLYCGADISVVKMSNDTQPITSIPTILITDSAVKRIVWNFYKNNNYNIAGFIKDYFGPLGNICSYSDGSIYIIDKNNNKIIKMRWENDKLTVIKEISDYINDNIVINAPQDIAVDDYGNIYIVSQYINPGIIKFNSNLEFISIIGNNFLKSPTAIAIDSQENLFICEFGVVIRKVNSAGTNILIKKISDFEYLPLNANFKTIDVDIFDNIYIVDTLNNCVYKFNNNLEFIQTYYGFGDKKFNELKSISVDKWYNYRNIVGNTASYGRVYVLEKQRIQIYDIGMDIVRVKPIKDTFSAENEEEAEIEYVLTEPGYQTVRVIDGDGKYIKTLINNEYIGMAGKRTVKWDGKDVNGNMVLEGDYIIEITAHDLYNGGKGNVTKTRLCPVTVYTPPKIWSLTAEPNVITPEQNITIKYLMSKKSFVYMDVVNANGDIVKKLLDEVEAIGGIKHIVIWDGNDSNNTEVPEGEYIIKVKAKQEGYAFDMPPFFIHA